MRRSRHSSGEERNGVYLLVAGLVALTLLLCAAVAGVEEDALETAIPNDCFARPVEAASDQPPEKLVCLTFDDGPSKNTQPILDILSQYNVPATFFVTAQENNLPYLPLTADIVSGGHQLALHSASHEYKKIYQSSEDFWLDIKALRRALADYVEVDSIHWLRFPGGSTNTISHKYGGSDIMKQLIRQAEEKGYRWIDWNVCAEDATKSHPNAEQILKNIRRDAAGKTICVVLLHDTKATNETVKALPSIIEWFAGEGYRFCTVAELEEPPAAG